MDLKPCPFCGCKQVYVVDTGIDGKTEEVECSECCSTARKTQWNTRTEDPELTAAREVIRIAKENTTGLVTADFMKAIEQYDKQRSGDGY